MREAHNPHGWPRRRSNPVRRPPTRWPAVARRSIGTTGAPRTTSSWRPIGHHSLAGADLEALVDGRLLLGRGRDGQGRQGACVPRLRRRGQSPASGVSGARHRARARLLRALLDRVGMDGPGGAPARGRAESASNGYLALLRSEIAAFVRQARRRARARAAGHRHRQPGRQRRPARLRPRRTSASSRSPAATTHGGLRPHGGGVDRRRQRRAVAVRERDHLLPDDLGLPRPDRLPARQRVDRGDRVVLQAPGGRRVPRRLPDPPCRGRGRRRGLGHGGAGADRATDELGGYNATPPQADGYYAIGDIRRLRAISPAPRKRSARPTPGAGRRSPRWRSSVSRRARRRRAQGDQRGARGRGPGTAGRAPACCRRRSRSRSRRATWHSRERPSRSSAGMVEVYSSPALEAEPGGGAGPGPARGGRRHGAPAHELRAAIKGWREVGCAVRGGPRPCAARDEPCAMVDDDEMQTSSCGPRSRSSGGSARRSTPRPPSASCGTPRSGGRARRTSGRTFMFTDIVGSTNLAEALGDAAWERLLRWHDDTLRGADRRRGRGDRQLDRRRLLRRLRRRAPGGRLRDRDPAVAAGPPRRHRLRARRSGSGCTRPTPTAGARTTAGWACTSRRASARSRAVARSSPRPMCSRMPGTWRPPMLREVSAKGVSQPIRVATISWA